MYLPKEWKLFEDVCSNMIKIVTKHISFAKLLSNTTMWELQHHKPYRSLNSQRRLNGKDKICSRLGRVDILSASIIIWIKKYVLLLQKVHLGNTSYISLRKELNLRDNTEVQQGNVKSHRQSRLKWIECQRDGSIFRSLANEGQHFPKEGKPHSPPTTTTKEAHEGHE